jgi:hypothetical protein
VTEQDTKHALEISEWFDSAVFSKYSQGVFEHGGHLPDKGGLLAEAEAECLDLPVYIRTLRGQLERVLEALRVGHYTQAEDSLAAILHGTPEDRLTV